MAICNFSHPPTFFGPHPSYSDPRTCGWRFWVFWWFKTFSELWPWMTLTSIGHVDMSRRSIRASWGVLRWFPKFFDIWPWITLTFFCHVGLSELLGVMGTIPDVFDIWPWVTLSHVHVSRRNIWITGARGSKTFLPSDFEILAVGMVPSAWCTYFDTS